MPSTLANAMVLFDKAVVVKAEESAAEPCLVTVTSARMLFATTVAFTSDELRPSMTERAALSTFNLFNVSFVDALIFMIASKYATEDASLRRRDDARTTSHRGGATAPHICTCNAACTCETFKLSTKGNSILETMSTATSTVVLLSDTLSSAIDVRDTASTTDFTFRDSISSISIATTI